MGHKSIKKWPESERPRERLLKHGAQSLSDAQLLAIILRIGKDGRSALDLAMDILEHFGNLRAIEDAAISEFCKIGGLGSAKIAQIKAAFELGKRLFEEQHSKGPMFSSGNDVYLYYRQYFKNLKKRGISLCDVRCKE